MSQMTNYLDLLEQTLMTGDDVYNQRTGELCKVVTGVQLKYDLSQGLPVLTNRKIPVRGVVGELISFFRGYTSATDFRSVGCNFWNGNANETKSWVESPMRKGEDDLGEIYGANWTSLKLMRTMSNLGSDALDYLVDKKGWAVSDKGGFIWKNVNQLLEVLRKILTDPSDRGIMITGINELATDFQSLRPCHLTYKFVPIPSKKVMHVVMDMRSTDLYLGLPANILSTSILLSIYCRLTGYTPGTVTVQMANAHIYESHLEATKVVLGLPQMKSPTLYLSDSIVQTDVVSGDTFSSITPEDIQILNYENAGLVPVRMVA